MLHSSRNTGIYIWCPNLFPRYFLWNTNAPCNSLRPPHNALHSPSYWGERERAPHLWIKRKFVYMVRAYSVYALCPTCVWCNISTLYRSSYMSKDIAKPQSMMGSIPFSLIIKRCLSLLSAFSSATIPVTLCLKARKMYVWLTYGIQRRRERLRPWNQRNRDCRAAGSTQQREEQFNNERESKG